MRHPDCSWSLPFFIAGALFGRVLQLVHVFAGTAHAQLRHQHFFHTFTRRLLLKRAKVDLKAVHREKIRKRFMR